MYIPSAKLVGAVTLLSVTASAAAADPSILLGKYFPPIKGLSAYVAWPSLSDACTSATFIALASPKDQGLCGHPFNSGNNPNFTNVEVTECQTLPSISPTKNGASPFQLCIPLTPNNVTCPGAEGKFEVDFLCGGPLTTG